MAGNVTIAGTATGATPLPVASTIDGANDYLPVYTASVTATQAINRNTLLGITGNPVGTTDSQVLASKTLTSPTINGATLSGTLSGTYTIGGTPTFPSSVVTLTGSQTLTNKTLTSPTINTPSITNATITADTVSGFTTSNSGTIYGISVVAGQISTLTLTGLLTASNGLTVSGGTLTLPNNSVTASALATTAITLGYASSTTSFTQSGISSNVFYDVTSISVTVTVPAGGRRVKVSVGGLSMSGSVGSPALLQVAIREGGTTLGQFESQTASSTETSCFCMASFIPTAGSHTYKMSVASNQSSGNLTVNASSVGPSFILVEAI